MDSCHQTGDLKSDAGLIPVQSDLRSAPSEVKQLIRCSCKTGCRKPAVHMQQARYFVLYGT